MEIRFLRGDPQRPKGHAIIFARSTNNPRFVLSTYGVVPPIPMSIAKYLPSFLAAQLPPEELREAANVPGTPIPPMLEEGGSLEHLQMLAERRDDDLCEIDSVNPEDQAARMQMAAQSCHEYGLLYQSYAATFAQTPGGAAIESSDEPLALDELDTEELLAQTMTDRQRLTELGKLVGTARYALDGHDSKLLQETKQQMQRLISRLPDKYRGSELVASATEPGERGAKLAQLYLERGFKLLDEEYADIPRIERAIRELRESQSQS